MYSISFPIAVSNQDGTLEQVVREHLESFKIKTDKVIVSLFGRHRTETEQISGFELTCVVAKPEITPELENYLCGLAECRVSEGQYLKVASLLSIMRYEYRDAQKASIQKKIDRLEVMGGNYWNHRKIESLKSELDFLTGLKLSDRPDEVAETINLNEYSPFPAQISS